MKKECKLEVRENLKSERFIKLYRSNYDAVFRYCVHRLFDRDAAEDITSQVFLKAVENFGCLNDDTQQIRNWLYKVATNAVNNHLRKLFRHNGHIQNLSESTRAGEDNNDFSAETKSLLKRAILSLKPAEQTIITLRFFEKMKIEEIAELTGSNPGTVRSRLSRALAKLRKKMNIDNDAFQTGGK